MFLSSCNFRPFERLVLYEDADFGLRVFKIRKHVLGITHRLNIITMLQAGPIEDTITGNGCATAGTFGV
jgi:hypothetical protein